MPASTEPLPEGAPPPAAAADPVLFASPEVTEADIEAVTAVLRSGWLTTGVESAQLERDLQDYLGSPHAVAVSSCTAALEIALAHLRLPAGARVGVPAWTFASTALAAVHNGLQPVLLDVDPGSLNLDAAALEPAVADGLDAVIAVHFGGVPVDRSVRDQCTSAGIPLIEDAAHALGASDDRGLIGGAGTSVACFSFYATKNLTSAEGGALTTDDPDLAAFARTYRLHGMSTDSLARYRPGAPAGYDVHEAGIKANLPDVLAALARSQLRRFAEMQDRRRHLLHRYRRNLEPAGIRFVPEVVSLGSADHLAAVLLPAGSDRNGVAANLRAVGIQTSIHFRPLHHLQWFAANALIGPGGLPVCDEAAPRALSLPLHLGLTAGDVDRVCTALLDELAR